MVAVGPRAAAGLRHAGVRLAARSSGRSSRSTRATRTGTSPCIGTDPSAQGKGIGGALIRQVTDRCDRIGLPCYLESSKDVNVPYYERFGFEVTGETRLGKDGPTIWFMWRDPQVPGSADDLG